MDPRSLDAGEPDDFTGKTVDRRLAHTLHAARVVRTDAGELSDARPALPRLPGGG
jgi:hypothetical protein